MTRRRAKPTPLKRLIVVVHAGSPGQFEIENAPGTIDNFETDYVHIGGYFGRYDPHLFAHAPEMAAALKAMVEAAEEVRFTNLNGPLAMAKAAMLAAKVA